MKIKYDLKLPVRESVPGPVNAIHTVGQTEAHHPLVATVISALSGHFCHCSFPPKVNLQPLVTIVGKRAPGPGFTGSGDLIKAGKLWNAACAVGCRC